MSRRKKRFGVAIDSTIAEKLDAIASSMNMDRSRLVEKALSEFLEEYTHGIENHRCCGVMVAEVADCKGISKVIELYSDIIVSYTHSHVEKRCVCTLIILGSSQRVLDLHKSIMLISSSRARYIPIAHG